MFTITQILQLRKSFAEVRKRKKKNKPPENNGILRRHREESIGNEQLIEQACKNLTENGINVFLVKKRDEALSILKNAVMDSKVIVKSKSNISKELSIPNFLEGLGKTVIETDIGDRLLQISGGKPSHPTGPASHLSTSEIIAILENYFGRKIGNTPEEIVNELKKDIISYIKEADIAIVGANAIAAEEGSILILHNEGNISEIIQRTKTLVVLAGIDKIYESLEKAVQMVKSVTYNATGAKVPSFINIISGPSKTADIEKRLIKGVHNPQQILLILLDDWRKEVVSGSFREILYCIGCGFCLVVCPMYNIVGDRFAYGDSLAGRGLILASVRNKNVRLAESANLCMTCYRCKWNCPININIPKMIWQIRKKEKQNNFTALLFSRFIYITSLLRLIKYQIGKYLKKILLKKSCI